MDFDFDNLRLNRPSVNLKLLSLKHKIVYTIFFSLHSVFVLHMSILYKIYLKFVFSIHKHESFFRLEYKSYLLYITIYKFPDVPIATLFSFDILIMFRIMIDGCQERFILPFIIINKKNLLSTYQHESQSKKNCKTSV